MNSIDLPSQAAAEVAATFQVVGSLLTAQSEDALPAAANDRRLAEALENAIAARSLIAGEQAKILARMAPLQPDSIDYRKLEYDHDLVALQLNRAADLAEQRRDYLDKIRTPAQQAAERAKCQDGIDGLLHWFYYWAWTADPRPDAPLYAVPFALFPFQEDGVEWLWRLIYEKRTDGTVDKSRDMGVSWMVVGFGVHQWSAAPKRAPFFALYGSRKEDFVDTRGDMDSLFEKIRFVVNLLPGWMLPRGWKPKEHSPYMKLVNPETGSTLKGESSNDDFGRGGRQTLIVFDEHASFPSGGYAAWTASSESTRTRLGISTPKGKFNKFAEVRHDDNTPSLSFHWKKHPWKDARWYEWQATRMSPVERAQELDLDYEGSLAGRLLTMWDERIHVITWSEFANFFGDAARDDKKKPRIPANWMIGMAHDVGTTADHPAVVLMAATAAEDTAMPGCVFFFKEIVIPEGGIPSIMAPLIREVADPWNLWENLQLSLISHEGNSERLTYETLGVFFDAWDTEQGYAQGYTQLQEYLTPDASLIHPFRPDYRDATGRHPGCPRMFVVVDDDQGGLVPDIVDGEPTGWKSRPAKDPAKEDDPRQGGFYRLRLEFPQIHIPQSEQGKPAKARRHFKKLDDAFDCARALAAQFFPSTAEKSTKQRLRERLPEHYKGEQLQQNMQDNLNGTVYGLLATKKALRREMDEDEGGGMVGIGKHARGPVRTVRDVRKRANEHWEYDDDDDD